MNALHLLINSAKDYPNGTALVFEDRSWSYESLVEEILRTADGLQRIRIGKTDKVGLALGNVPEYIISYYAILALGAVAVPFNPNFKKKEVTYLLNDSGAKVVIANQQATNVILESYPDLISLETIVHHERDHEELSEVRLIPFFNLRSTRRVGICNLNGDEIAHIIYTSGTTGNPKGAMITHDNLIWMASTCSRIYEIKKNDRILCALPLFHAYAKLQCILSPLSVGSTVYLEETFIPDVCLKKFEEKKITVFFGVPAMYVMFVNSEVIEKYDFGSLRCCVSGGASIAVEVIKKVRDVMGIEICEGYGLTESTVLCTTNPYAGLKKIGSIGLPLPGVEIKVIQSNGEEAPVGEYGELIVKGPNIMRGYYNKTIETEKALIDGWLYTGDVAYRDPEGYLYIVDRKKDMIIRNGYNVYPREIEEVLYTHNKVKECAVIGVPDEKRGEEIAAYIVLREDESALPEEIAKYCEEYLIHYKLPRIINFVKELPKNSTGKIMKKALKELVNTKS